MPVSQKSRILQEFTPEIQDKGSALEKLHDLLQRYGRIVNLTGSLESEAIWREIGEALLAYRVAQKLKKEDHRWIDIGSGGGFPGLVFALLMRDQNASRGLLIEPRKRRADFLQLAQIQLRIANLEVMRGSLEEDGKLSPTPKREPIDWVSARAVFSPPEWVRRAGLAWPEAHCMVHGRYESPLSPRADFSDQWLDHRVELWAGPGQS